MKYIHLIVNNFIKSEEMKIKGQNPQKPFFSNKGHITKLKLKEKLGSKNTRASKSVKRFVIERQQAWDHSFVHSKMLSAASPPLPPFHKPHKTRPNDSSSFYLASSNLHNPTRTSETKFRIKRSCSPRNMFSVRSVSNHYLVNKRLLSNVSVEQGIASLEYDVVRVYSVKQIPSCHVDLVKQIRSKLSKEEELQLLKRQLKEIQSPASCIFSLKLLCQARQNCLLTIKSITEVIRIDEGDRESKMKYLKQHIKDLRSLGLNCIQHILKWREIIQGYCKPLGEKIDFRFSYCEEDEGNYLMKLFTDNKFIHETQLFETSSFPDPFFLSYYPDQELEIGMKEYFKIRACELFLLQESLK